MQWTESPAVYMASDQLKIVTSCLPAAQWKALVCYIQLFPWFWHISAIVTVSAYSVLLMAELYKEQKLVWQFIKLQSIVMLRTITAVEKRCFLCFSSCCFWALLIVSELLYRVAQTLTHWPTLVKRCQIFQRVSTAYLLIASVMMCLLHIYCGVLWWKHFEHQLALDEVVAKRLVLNANGPAFWTTDLLYLLLTDVCNCFI